jgi:tetratricopeptide (TPR) repeat protein
MPNPSGSLSERFAHAMKLAQSGDREGALASLALLNTLRPNTPEILFNIGKLELELGRPEAAEKPLRVALKLRPKEAAIWQALHAVLTGAERRKLEREAGRAGIVLGSEADVAPVYEALRKGAHDTAEARALALVKAAPGAVAPALALGEARMARGAWAGALGPLEKAHERAPNLARAGATLGETLAQLERFARAEPLLQTAAEAGGRARLPLARMMRRTMRTENAVEILQKALSEAKSDRALEEELALALADLGDGAAAMKAADRAIALGSPSVPMMRRVADALQSAGASDAAEKAIAAALKVSPDHPDLLTHQAQLRQSSGDLASAEAELQAIIAAHPAAAEACRAYVNGRRIEPDDKTADMILARVADPALPRNARRVLHFAAAKIRMDRKDPTAFEHLRTANRISAEMFPYSFDADIEEARRLVSDWSTLSEWAPEGPQDKVLFVTGLPRSGTTLVETILSAHPTVTAGGEMPFLSRASAPAIERLRAGGGSPLDFAEAGRRYLAAARRRTGTDAVFTDKAISTFTRVGHVAAALPGARIVILRRDPRDVGLSLYRNMFPDGLFRFTYDLGQIGRYIRLHDALVDFWSRACPERVHVVDYEALTEHPEPHIRDLLAFCGLDWDDACLAPEKSTRRVETLSFSQVRAPIGRAAVAGWRRHAGDLQPLIEAMEATTIDLGA